MKKSVKAVVFSLIGIILICLSCIIFSMSVMNDKLEDELTSSLHTSGYLRSRIRDLDMQIESLRYELENMEDDVQCIQTETAGEQVEAVTTSPAPKRAYRVGEFDGRVAIFADGQDSTEPIRVLDISVMALSESERQELAAGIFASDYDSLCKIIDRYE